MTHGRTASVVVMILAFLILPGLTQATVMVPGPGAFPRDIFAGCTGCTLLASFDSGPVTSNGILTFDVVSAVYSDPSNTFGAGDLDFMYQVTNAQTSTDSIGRVTAINFTGFQTDVGFTPLGSTLPGGLFVDGTVAPELVDRNSTSTVGFSFNAPLTLLIGPGQTSTVLIIQTDATGFGLGKVNVIDGGAAAVDALAPAAGAQTPEPATMLLLVSGLSLLGAARRKRLV